MRATIKPLFFTAALLAAGAVQAEPDWLDGARMDRIYAESRQEIQLAQRYRTYDRYPRHRPSRRSNNWVAPLVAGALIGAIISNHSSQTTYGYSNKGAYKSAKRRCAREYRSYDWDSDTFVTYGGVVKLCPYVRSYYP
ncbi:MAG: BA14K family protein [Gammaproteobacteria bacterium]|nr:BA14K family protein [Gammaproteobacteria bacterium]